MAREPITVHLEGLREDEIEIPVEPAMRGRRTVRVPSKVLRKPHCQVTGRPCCAADIIRPHAPRSVSDCQRPEGGRPAHVQASLRGYQAASEGMQEARSELRTGLKS